MVNNALTYNIFGTKGIISLIFDNGVFRCCTSQKCHFVEFVEKLGSEKPKGTVKYIKIKVRGIVKYNLEDDNGHVITLRISNTRAHGV